EGAHDHDAHMHDHSHEPELTVMEGSRIEILDDEALQLIDPEAKVEQLRHGFEWSEGPVIAPDSALLFSDIPMNKVFRWKDEDGLTEYLDPAGATGPVVPTNEPGSNGLLIDSQGRLVLCQHGDRRIGRMKS